MATTRKAAGPAKSRTVASADSTPAPRSTRTALVPAQPGPPASAPAAPGPAKKAPPRTPQRSTAPEKPAAGRHAGPSPDWSAAELDAVRAQLDGEVAHLCAEVVEMDDRLSHLIHGSADGAGDDQAESGSKAFEREHEQTLAKNANDVIVQSRHALDRLDSGTYGTCESCGLPIGKPRLQAFPRATLCMRCKQREEHR